MSQAQDDAFIAVLKPLVAVSTRPTTTQWNAFRIAANQWLATKALPVVSPASFVLTAGYGLDQLVGAVVATQAPTSYEIVSGDPNGYFKVWPSGNLRTSETILALPGSYSLGVRAINANGAGLPATISVLAQGQVEPQPPPPPPPPPSGDWPDATNTGVPAGMALTVHNSPLIIDTPGAVVSGLDIRGSVRITAANVTLQNCKVTANTWDWYAINCEASGATVQYCTIDGSNADGIQNINGPGTFLRNNIFRCDDGIAPGSNTLIQDNYIHDLTSPGHHDGIEIDGGQSNVTIRHNTIINQADQTSAIMIDNYAGPIDGIVVDNNRLIGGGYTVYCADAFSGGPIANVSFTNNRLGKGVWGYTSFYTTHPVFTGNVDDVTGVGI